MKEIEFPKVGMFAVLRAMWAGIRPQRVLFFFTMLAFVIGNISTTFVPVFYKKFFDTITLPGGDPRAAVPVLMTIIITIAGLNFLRWTMMRLGTFGVHSIETNTMARLRQMAFNYLIHHSHRFFANSFTGSLVQRVSRFARSLERLVDTLSFNLIPLIVTIIGAVTVTWYTERVLAYIIIVWIAVFIGCNYLFSLWRVKYNVRISEADSKTTGTLADIIGNQSAVSLFSAFRHEKERFKGVTDSQARITKFTWDVTGLFDAVQAGLVFIAEFAVFYYAIPLWSTGAITVGTFVLVQVYVISLTAQLWDFGRIVRSIYEVFADSKEMVEIMALPHEIRDVPGAREMHVAQGEIQFKNVSFNFNQTRKVLDDIDVVIPGAEKVALVGPSGAGKTTIVRLLLRLHDVTSGQILIDGQDVKTVTLDSLHNSISLVPQDPVLFHRTLMENIRYGRADATDDEVIHAAKLAHCDEFIDSLPEKYETYVGERGIKLSGGERQRIAIARAILKDAPILILDEATSSLDSNSEMLIQDALDTLMKNKTAIIIAHRLSTIRKMDRIIVVDGGKITEDGSHDSLLQNPESLYKKLWELQAGGFIVDTEKKEKRKRKTTL